MPSKSRTAGSCTVKNSDFVACVGFLKGSYESFLFDKNKVIGSCSDFLYLSIENKARISGSRFFLPDKPTFEAKDENNRPGDAFIHCRGKKVLFINNVFKGEKLSENSYMEEHYIYAIWVVHGSPSRMSGKMVWLHLHVPTDEPVCV